MLLSAALFIWFTHFFENCRGTEYVCCNFYEIANDELIIL